MSLVIPYWPGRTLLIAITRRGAVIAGFTKEARKREELAEAIAADVVEGRERVEKRIAEVRQEIEDGAFPRKDRFRL